MPTTTTIPLTSDELNQIEIITRVFAALGLLGPLYLIGKRYYPSLLAFFNDAGREVAQRSFGSLNILSNTNNNATAQQPGGSDLPSSENSQNHKHLHHHSGFFFTPLGNLVIAIAFSDLINSAVALTARAPMDLQNFTLCQAQAVLMYTANLSSVFLGLLLSLNSFYILFLEGNVEFVRRWQPTWIWLTFIVPTIVGCIPVFFNTPTYTFFGPTTLWCWVSNPANRILYFYTVLWIMIVLNLIVCLIIGFRLTQMKNGIPNNINNNRLPPTPTTQSSKAKRTQRILLFLLFSYSLAIIISWIPSSLNRLNDMFVWEEHSYWFVVGQAVFQPMRGTFGAIAYHFSINSMGGLFASSTNAALPPGRIGGRSSKFLWWTTNRSGGILGGVKVNQNPAPPPPASLASESSFDVARALSLTSKGNEVVVTQGDHKREVSSPSQHLTPSLIISKEVGKAPNNLAIIQDSSINVTSDSNDKTSSNKQAPLSSLVRIGLQESRQLLLQPSDVN